MSTKDYFKGHASTSKAPGTIKDWAGGEPGPFIAIVKNNVDPLRMGRLQVNIPALSKTADPISGNLFTCEYLSPFYGAKDVKYNVPGSTKYEHSQHSYGFWAVPPDIGTRVLVIFAEGKLEQAFWIGCLQDPVTNHMVPGIAASEKTWDKDSGGPAGQFSSGTDKQKTYGTKNVPAGEVNRQNPGSNPALKYDTFNKPIHPLADILAQQGLSPDEVRGTTTSSARRETPSSVFGISTPGPKDTKSTKQFVGTKDVRAQDYVTRKIGHTLVMDDGDVDGNNQLTRLRTASGHQLLMHDTEGVVYLANGSGKAFIEMEKNGKINIYSDRGIAIRAEGDFNLHSDKNINFHAKEKINFTAEENVVLNAEKFVYVMGESGILGASQKGSVRHFAKDGITSHTKGIQFHSAEGRIDLATSKEVHLNSVGPRSVMGPGWLEPSHNKVDLKPIKVQDIIAQEPIKNGKPNYEKTKAKTTVMDSKTNRVTGAFVTHEPYDRTASKGRDKDDIA